MKNNYISKKYICAGLLAHVDSGKTTLSESLLFSSGNIQKLGRVDHKNAFLDTNHLEKERGITIYSKEAIMQTDNLHLTLVDTPGHVDFAPEMERAMWVMDYAILVISGTELVQSHTETLERLLYNHGIPTFIFVNKMDISPYSKEEIMHKLQKDLSDHCIDISRFLDTTDNSTNTLPSDTAHYSTIKSIASTAIPTSSYKGSLSNASTSEALLEELAMKSQLLLDEYLETHSIKWDSIKRAIKTREIIPCFFGSALKMQGIEAFKTGLEALMVSNYADSHENSKDIKGKVFRITQDAKGQRLTHIKITSGKLMLKGLVPKPKVNNSLNTSEKILESEEIKINEIRLYSGSKYQNLQEAYPGMIVAIPGLQDTEPGQTIGNEESLSIESEPLFNYALVLPQGEDEIKVLSLIKEIAKEETKMKVQWNPYLREITLQLMGEIQKEVLKQVLFERFNLDVDFTQGSIQYLETITNTVEGVGHYEPLRHYAEVHLLLEPSERGSGISFCSNLREDQLDLNWQRLILTHIAEKEHLGVLTGSPITDIKISLIQGKAHQKHTEGGDFRQATYRAIRQGLMQANSVLLEPYYQFKLEVPNIYVGRAMTDLQQMSATFAAPNQNSDYSVLEGKAPVSKLAGYQKQVIAYTRGLGKLSCRYAGYDICQDQEDVISLVNYNLEADIENTPDSIFCSHGAGHIVKWNEVFQHAHLPLLTQQEEETRIEAFEKSSSYRDGDNVSDTELARIFERTYGKIKETSLQKKPFSKPMPEVHYKGKEKPITPEDTYLLVDGYNIIFAWEDLKKVAQESLDLARTRLIDRIANYSAFQRINTIIVFDAYKVKGAIRKQEQIKDITIIYTKEAETADQYIEQTSMILKKKYHVRVATSDNLEQIIILGHGAHRVSANEFLQEVKSVEEEMKKYY